MAELADAQDSDSCPGNGGAGSSPVIRTKNPTPFYDARCGVLFLYKNHQPAKPCGLKHLAINKIIQSLKHFLKINKISTFPEY